MSVLQRRRASGLCNTGLESRTQERGKGGVSQTNCSMPNAGVCLHNLQQYATEMEFPKT